MGVPPIDNNQDRLRELHEYSILDTPPETSFNQLAFLAAKIAQTPIALLSFLDHKRQWVKASYGIEVKEINLQLSACQYTIRQQEVFEIQDGQSCGWPSEFLRQHDLRYYAGVPIRARSGLNIGVLCVIDKGPRKLTEEQLKILRTLARHVHEALEVRRQYQENLRRLNKMFAMRLPPDQHSVTLVHSTAARAFAEISTGLIARFRPLLMNIQNFEKLSHDPSYEVGPADLEILFEAGRSMFRVVHSLENFVQSQRENSMKPLDISSVIGEALTHLNHKFIDQRIQVSVTVDEDLRCVGNLYKLTEALYCILNNAVEAVALRANERRIDVTIRHASPASDHRALIIISDNGHGVSESIREYIFYPFFTTKAEEGMGIGLALAKAHLQVHGGDVRLIHPAGPTVFEVSIPIPQ